MTVERDMSAIKDTPPGGQKPGGGSYRALIVDDSLFIAKQLGQILSSGGFEVAAAAADGAQGVEKYKELYPNIDMVIMDITMPVMDGVSALEKILEFDKDAKLIMIGALGKEDVVKKCILMGAKNVIVKPLEQKKVLDTVVSVLNQSS